LLCLDGKCVSAGDDNAYIFDIRYVAFNGGCDCGISNFTQGIIIDEARIYKDPIRE